MRYPHIKRSHLSTAIWLTGWVLCSTLAWQAVRFCQGKIGFPVADQMLEQALGMPFEKWLANDGPFPFFRGIVKIIYYAYGIFFWLLVAVWIFDNASYFARIVEFGSERTKLDVSLREQRMQRRATLERYRARRKERLYPQRKIR